MTRVTLHEISPDGPRFFIRADERHAGGITVHSVRGDVFSYGVAVAETMRRRGVAKAALALLFARMKKDGFTRAVVEIRAENAASLALHRSLGFMEVARENSVVTMKKTL